MAEPAHISETPDTRATVRRLVALRWWVLAAETLAILGVPPLLDIPLPWLPMLTVVAVQVLVNGLAARRIGRGEVFGAASLLGQLAIDLMALSVLTFFSGGAANPLISLLLPPVAIAALVLPPRQAAAVAALAVAAYSLLMVLYLPLPVADPGRAARLHLAGMWFTFVLSAVMVAWFVTRMTASIRARDAALAAAREQSLRDERVIALGALAAGAAHELGTPLATIAVIAGELEHDASLDAAARADVVLLRRQVATCKEIITDLAERAGADRLDSARAVPADVWLEAVFARWRGLRPKAAGSLSLEGLRPGPTMVAEATLEQGIVNLLNNAADAGGEVALSSRWDGSRLFIEIRDRGPGFPPQVLAQAGKAPFPAHGNGSGIGLFLAHAAIERLGGSLALMNTGEGALARVELPLSQAKERS